MSSVAASSPGNRRLPPPFRLAGRRVEPALNRVVGRDEVVQLEPKIMAVLLCLTEQPGEVLSRETLMAQVWPDVHVGEDVLTRSIAELRKVFDDDPRTPRVIDTIRKRGYRLIAEVEPSPPDDELSAASALEPGDVGGRPAAGRARGRRLLTVAVVVAALAAGWTFLRLLTSSPSTTIFADRPTRAEVPRVAPLTSLPGTERDPAVADDGSRVAYSVVDEERGTARLFVQLRGAEGRQPLTDGESEDRYPVFSPDGTRVAFVRRLDGRCNVFVTTVMGGPERRLTTCHPTATRQLDWSPDGRHLAISDRLPGARVVALVLVDVDTAERRWLTRPRPPSRGDLEPAFSPDGEAIAFTRVVGGTVSDVWTVDVASGEERRLTFDNRDVVGQDWSVDGSRLIFSSSRGGTYALWSLSLAGGEPQWLTGSGSKIKHPSVARSLPIVAWEDWLLEINVWGLSLEAAPGSAPLSVVESTQWDYAPHPDPSAERLAFVSTRSGETAVWILDRSTGAEHRLSPAGMEVLSTVRWSPDGERLAFVAAAEGQIGLYLVAPGEATVRLLVGDGARKVAPAWSHDGRSLLVGADRAGDWRVWRYDLATGATSPEIDPGSYAAQEGPDGRLYWVRADRSGLWTRSRAGETILLAGDLEPQNWADWTVTEKGVYYLAHDPETGEALLRSVPAGGGASRTVARLGDVARPGLSVTADGGTVFFSRVDRAECDLMLAENLG